jgi:integrase
VLQEGVLMKAWPFQDPKQVAKVGTEKASWYVGWRDPAGKRRSESCGPGKKGKRLAEQKSEKLHAQLVAGNYQAKDKTTWKQFREEYESKVLAGKAVKTQAASMTSLNHFERIVKPGRVSILTTQDVDDFIAARRKESGQKRGSKLSPASINHDLRHIKAALRVAREWEYLTKLPRFRMEREMKGLPTYVTGDHLALIYRACDHARMPSGRPYEAADWWRALIVMGYLTGWRISDMLALRRSDLDLATGTTITRAEDNKGKRDEKVKLHIVVVDHLQKLFDFDPCVFTWHHNRRTLHAEFARIQEAAGIKLPCNEKHTHTRYCHVYGFHDLRRAFATMNADKLTPDALQTLMRHKSYQTTQVYINMARQMDEAVASLHVPEFLRQAT